MSVLIFVDQSEGSIKKSSYEALSYGYQVAQKGGMEAEAVILGEHAGKLEELGAYGIKRVHHVSDPSFNHFNAKMYATSITELVRQLDARMVILSHNINGRTLAPRLSIRLKAGLVTGAVALPDMENGFRVRRNVFSGKAFAEVSVLTSVKIVSVQPNAVGATKVGGEAEVVSFQSSAVASTLKVIETRKVKGMIPLGEAELVVSGGRGLKGPEHWGLVEDLAGLLGAATACSRAVADAHWRPHHEHVGQTGLAIAPNLYIAIGISGAIQHLAGVNRSKVIVVINKDPEAPFFKAADYGIVGDAFEVMPRIIDAVRKLKTA